MTTARMWTSLSWSDIIERLRKMGYSPVRQRGSHVRMVHPSADFPKITVPNHREVSIGIISKICRDLKIPIERFRSM